MTQSGTVALSNGGETPHGSNEDRVALSDMAAGSSTTGNHLQIAARSRSQGADIHKVDLRTITIHGPDLDGFRIGAETISILDETNLLPETSADKAAFDATADICSLWENLREQLRNKLDPQIFAAWIKPLKAASLEVAHQTPTLTVFAPNKFCSDHVQRHYGDLISSLSATLLGLNEVALIVKVFAQSAPPAAKAEGQNGKLLCTLSSDPLALAGVSVATAPAQQRNESPVCRAAAAPSVAAPGTAQPAERRAATILKSRPTQAPELEESNLNPKYNFSNYVVGGCNQFAHAACLKVSENLGHMYNPLFIYGGVGLGKTHLANAIGNASRRRKKKALLISSETFVTELISSLKSNNMERFRSKFRSLDLLIVDDIQFIIGKERTQEEFFHTFNDLYNRHKQIIITSDKVPQELTGLEERLRTRFACGLSADLQAPDFETRVAILNKKAEATGSFLPDDVARLIAERINTNVRELEGALNRLQAFCSLHDSAPTLRLAEEVLRSIAPEKTREITAEHIQKTVAARYNVSFSDILGKRRTHNIAFARQVAMYLCRHLTNCSYPELGALFGGRDHSTVIHAHKVITERLENDSVFAADLQNIKKELLS